MLMKKTSIGAFSLIEILLVVAFISLILIMATRYFSTTNNAQLTDAAVQQIQGIRSAVSAMSLEGLPFGSDSNYNINIAAMCNAGRIPSTDCSGSSLLTPWKQTSSDNAVLSPVSTNDLFKLTYQFPNYSLCMATKNNFAPVLDTASCDSTGLATLNFLK